MKLPDKKRKELEQKGKRKSPPEPGDGALGRLRQFEQQRGLDQADPSNPPAARSPKAKARGARKAK